MAEVRRTVRVCGVALGSLVTLGIAVDSCGVQSPGDCTDKATCIAPDGADDTSSPDVFSEGADEPAGDDDASDVVSLDVEGDADALTGDVRSTDVVSEDVLQDAEASIMDAGKDVRDATDAWGPCASIDCQNPNCLPTYTCAPPVPSTGWVGPAMLWQGPYPAAAVPSCPTGYQDAFDGFAGPTGTADTCSCNCTVSGETCSATVTEYSQTMCQGSSSCASVATPSGGCMALSGAGCGSNGSVNATTTSPAGGTCTPTPTITQRGTTAGWSTTARVCSWITASTGGCNAGQACVLAPRSPGFNTTLCVYRSGNNATCPAGYGNGPYVFYAAETDSRACGACTCSGPSGGSCSGSATIFSGTSCTGVSQAVALTAACSTYTNLSPHPQSVSGTYTVSSGTCTVATPSQPQGSVTPTTPTSVCCM